MCPFASMPEARATKPGSVTRCSVQPSASTDLPNHCPCLHPAGRHVRPVLGLCWRARRLGRALPGRGTRHSQRPAGQQRAQGPGHAAAGAALHLLLLGVRPCGPASHALCEDAAGRTHSPWTACCPAHSSHDPVADGALSSHPELAWPIRVSSRIADGSPSQPPPDSTPESAQAYLFLFLFLAHSHAAGPRRRRGRRDPLWATTSAPLPLAPAPRAAAGPATWARDSRSRTAHGRGSTRRTRARRRSAAARRRALERVAALGHTAQVGLQGAIIIITAVMVTAAKQRSVLGRGLKYRRVGRGLV
jgi:hypothetical protein